MPSRDITGVEAIESMLSADVPDIGDTVAAWVTLPAGTGRPPARALPAGC